MKISSCARKRLALAAIGISVICIFAVSCLIGIWFLRGNSTPASTSAPPDPNVEPISVPTVEVIVAQQPISKGSEFVFGSISRRDLPVVDVPADAIIHEDETVGKIANQDIAEGEVIVRSMLLGPGLLTVSSALVTADGVLYFGRNSGIFYVVDATTEEELWRFETDGPISTPVIVDGIVYFSGGSVLYAMDARTGREKWRLEILGDPTSAPVIVDGVMYFVSDDGYAHYAYELDIQTGEVGRRPSKIKVELTSAPTIVDGIMYFVSSDYFYAVDVENGQIKWKIER